MVLLIFFWAFKVVNKTELKESGTLCIQVKLTDETKSSDLSKPRDTQDIL